MEMIINGELRSIFVEYKKKKDGTVTATVKSFEGRIIPKSILIVEYFSAEQGVIDETNIQREQDIKRKNI